MTGRRVPVARAAMLAVIAFVCLLVPGFARADSTSGPDPKEPPTPCTEDCYQLSSLTFRGGVTTALTFELRGTVRSKEEQKIPLFGPPGQVRLDDLVMDGGRPSITFDSDKYYLLTSAKSFTLRGKITLGTDQIVSVTGPLLTVDAHLTKGRLVEGEKLSGVANTVLHFDPMTDDKTVVAKPSTPPVFRLARSIRFGTETTFVYRLVMSHSADLGTIKLPLAFGEKVQDVQGSTGWKSEDGELTLPTNGHDAEITISGSLPPSTTIRTFKADERSAYEWWMIEADPEHRVGIAGEAKLVDTSQSPIPATMPGPRVYLIQRGQHLEVDARSLVRGDVLAAVARTNKRFVAITGGGELISDESILYDNNGLEHLMVTPAGRAMYLSTDAVAQRILHTEAGARDVLVPVKPGQHVLRVQSLADVKLWPLAGAVSVPAGNYPIATSAMEITVGLPEHVHPLAVLGGDHSRWAFSRGDLIAVILGIALSCFGFRDRKTRALGALVTAGLWFVSREGYVFAAGGLFVVGAIFLASRFIRGTKLIVASGAVLIAALFTGRYVLVDGVTAEPHREMIAEHPSVPTPESSHAAVTSDGSLDTKAGVTPVSLSIPTSERYVQSSRQLVTKERPFVARIVYMTSTTIAILHFVWLALVGALAFLHRDRLAALKAALIERVTRRTDPTEAPVADPVAPL